MKAHFKLKREIEPPITIKSVVTELKKTKPEKEAKHQLQVEVPLQVEKRARTTFKLDNKVKK